MIKKIKKIKTSVQFTSVYRAWIPIIVWKDPLPGVAHLKLGSEDIS